MDATSKTKLDKKHSVGAPSEKLRGQMERKVSKRLSEAVLYESIRRAGRGADNKGILEAADGLINGFLESMPEPNPDLGDFDEPKVPSPKEYRCNLVQAQKAMEKELIGYVLQKTGGDIALTARAIGISQRALRYKMREYGLGWWPRKTQTKETRVQKDNPFSIRKMTDEMEKRFIKAALEETGGSRAEAAKLLQISHRALLYKIKEYGISE